MADPKEPPFAHFAERYQERHQGVEPTPYKSYAEVPFHQKRWFFIVLVLFLTPVAIVLALTSEIYMESNGQVLKFSRSRRLGIAATWTVILLMNVLRYL